MRTGTARVKGSRMADASIQSERTHVLPLEFGRAMPVIARGDGVWIEDVAGRRYLDAMSGGSMAATLGHGRARHHRGRPRPGRDSSPTRTTNGSRTRSRNGWRAS